MRINEILVEAYDPLAKYRNVSPISYNHVNLFVVPKNGVYAFKKEIDIENANVNQAIAWIGLDPEGNGLYSVTDAYVARDYARQGIATAMYQAMINTGTRIIMSSEGQTSEGTRMWRGWSKNGIAKQTSRGLEFIGH